MALTLSAALADPEQVRAALEASYGHHVVAIRRLQHGLAIDVEFRPPTDLDGYSTERARITISPEHAISAYPLGPDRSWEHRNLSPARRAGEGLWYTGGTLCLYYVDDPVELRWVSDDGLEAYVLLVYRHLFYEEYFRRHGRWPVEDAPHGHSDGDPHPIQTSLMREAVRRRAALRRPDVHDRTEASSAHG